MRKFIYTIGAVLCAVSLGMGVLATTMPTSHAICAWGLCSVGILVAAGGTLANFKEGKRK